MPQYSAFLKALGLLNEQNQLAAPPGSMTDAENVIIRRDNVVEPRRGFKLYGTSFGTGTDVAKQIMEYRNRIIRHFDSTLQWDTEVENSQGQSIFNTFSGSFSEVQSGLRIKSIEANNNLYFTTSDGIKKISAKSADDFTTSPGFITDAGGIKALDIDTRLAVTYGSNDGFLPVDSAVAYRVLWGQTDANNNLILGTPSSPSVVYNSLSQMIVRDMMEMLYQLDQLNIPGSRINNADYVTNYALPLNASATQIVDNLSNLCTELDQEQGTLFATGDILDCSIANGTATIELNDDVAIFGRVSLGDKIFLNGFTPTSGTLNGVQTVTDIESTESHQVTQIITVGASSLAAAGPGSYFLINDANNVDQYYVWYFIGTSTDPTPGGTGIQVNCQASDSPQTVAENTVAALNQFQNSFHATSVSNTITVTNVDVGPATPASDVSTGFTITTPVNGSTIVGQILFQTSASGAVSLTNQSIESGQFRGITVPDESIVPPNHNELAALQTYLQNIILELQSDNNLREVAKNNGSASVNPLEITSAAVTGTTTLTINFDTSVSGTDAGNQFKSGDLVFLAGTWTAAGAEDISGVHTVASVSTGNITITLSPAVTNGAVTLNPTSIIDQILRFTDGIQTQYINDLAITTTANVFVDITVPSNATVNTFFQIYRGGISTATGTDVLSDLIPNDEMVLVYEAFPTPSEISSRSITVEDIVPDSFTVGATDLYTNEISGQGILQANDVPPLAHDITVFQNYTWYANTSTRQRFTLNLLGVQQIINDYNNNLHPAITISNGTTTNTYYFIPGVAQVTQVTTVAGSFLANSGPASYFLINGGNNTDKYYAWYAIGTATDPMIAGRTGIQIFALASDNANTIAQKTAEKFETVVDDFTASVSTNVVTITNTVDGPATNASAGTSGFAIITTVQGQGENAAAKQVLLSTNVSPSIAVTETSQSLIRVINKNNAETINAFYTSSLSGVPGGMLFESKSLTNSPFYILTNTSGTGNSFSPSLAPSITGITNTAANPTVVTATAHGLVNGDQVVISGSNSTPSIDGLWTISGATTNTFTIPVNVTVPGTRGAIINALSSTAQDSSNEVKINRLYYSKLQQPEAVPLLNYLDIGSQNKAILRIFPLRDSLFVFKEDGLYRVSGQSAPWAENLFDSTVKLVASDSLGLANNLIYGWTKEGIITISEAGKQLISRPIDVLILPLSSSGLYPNFSTATWGIGYESDNAYYVFTVSNFGDQVATICYRYSNLTGTWTTYTKSNTCGIVKYLEDKLFLGAGDTDFLEVERKSFDRTDYADREYTKVLFPGNYLNGGINVKLDSLQHVGIGDILVQDQTLSVYTYNALLQKLDIDPQITTKNYFATLEAFGGDNMRTKIVQLAAKLDAEPGLSGFSNLIVDQISYPISSNSIASPTEVNSTNHQLQTGRLVTIVGVSGSEPTINGTFTVTRVDNNNFTVPVDVLTAGTGGAFTTLIEDFRDIKACYNLIITALNASPGVAFSNYEPIVDNTPLEVIIIDFNQFTGIITLNLALDLIQGPLTLYKAINSTFTYSPLTLNDPVGYKQIREFELYFENKTFTNAVMSFATDLLPEFIDVPFNGLGSGLFGNDLFGENFFGGDSNGIPFRTYIPRQCQRCRYLIMKFTHQIAREKFSVYGVGVTARVGISGRAYRG